MPCLPCRPGVRIMRIRSALRRGGTHTLTHTHTYTHTHLLGRMFQYLITTHRFGFLRVMDACHDTKC